MTIIWAESKGEKPGEPVSVESFRQLSEKLDKSLEERFEDNKSGLQKLTELFGIYDCESVIRITSQIALIVASIAVVRTLGLH